MGLIAWLGIGIGFFFLSGCAGKSPATTDNPTAPSAQYSELQSLSLEYGFPPEQSVLTGSLLRPDGNVSVLYIPLTWDRSQKAKSLGPLGIEAEITCSEPRCHQFTLSLKDAEFGLEKPLEGRIAELESIALDDIEGQPQTEWESIVTERPDWLASTFVEVIGAKRKFWHFNLFAEAPDRSLISLSSDSLTPTSVKYHHRSPATGRQVWSTETGLLQKQGKEVQIRLGRKKVVLVLPQ